MAMPGRKPRSPAAGSQDKAVGGGAFRLHLLAASVLGLSLLLADPAAAQQSSNSNVSPRAAAHEGFGRMVFDWDGPVTYSADVINGELVVRFDRPVSGDLRNLVRPLSHYVKSVAISDDHRTATFPLVRPVSVKSFTNASGSVVVDVSDSEAPPPSAQAQPAAEGAPTPLVPPQADAKKMAAEAVPSVEIKAGEHGGFNRLVFTWPKTVDYKVEKSGNEATVTFSKPGHLDVAGLQATLPSDITVKSSESTAKGASMVLTLPADARLRHFASGGKVVLNVVRNGDSHTAPPPAPPPAGTDVQPPSLKPLGPEEKPQLPSEVLAAGAKPGKMADKAPDKAPDKTGEKAAPSAMTAPAVPEPKFEHVKTGAEPPKPAAVPVADKIQVEPQTTDVPPLSALPEGAPVPKGPDDKVFSLSVSWDKPAAAAVFKRAGYLWVVFDRHQQVDAKLLKRLGGEAVTFLEQLPSKDGTVIRMIVQPDYYPSVRQEGLLWVIDLTHQEAVPAKPIQVLMPELLTSGVGIALNVAEAGSMLSVEDPEVGDSMVVVPVVPLGAGVYPGRDAPEAELLPTLQGIAVVPHVDGLDVRPSRSGVSVGFPGGMKLSQAGGAAGPAFTTKDNGHYFNVSGWKQSGPDKFPEERKVILDSLVDLPPSKRPQAHMDAAKFLFANGYAPEALGFLKIAASEEPTLLDSGPYHALRGACNAAMERWDLALPDLDNPLVKDDPEALFWRAAAHAGSSDKPAEYSKALAAGLPLIRDYPKALQWPLTAIVARSALAAADEPTLQSALSLMDRMHATPPQQGMLDYLHGAYGELTGKFDKALYNYDKAINGDNREFRARAAMADTELQLKMKRIKPREAVERMDRLRFSWRDEDFEFNLLRRLAELQIASGDYANALRAARSLVTNYPDNPGEPAVSKMMSDAFEALYLNGAADTLPPISAIGLYDEFRDLTPTGTKGDEMIRKLADRLASVDLLDRAAELLKHQVDYRLQGLDKARVGAQLALLDLLDQNPQGAIDAIQSSAMDGLPADLQDQRRHLLARGLADANRVPEAMKVLDGDTSQEGGLLRAEIYWRKQDWANAANAFEGLVPRPEPGATLDDGSARLIISWATALTLAGDDRGLASLRRAFGQGMAGTPYKDGFTLLTSADREVSDLPALRGRIKEAESFLGFMSNYRKRLMSNGLSKIN